MARSVDEVYNSLGGVYDPQTTLLTQQISQADIDAQTQQASLDQAKVNAFKDIDKSANSKGILFSGFSPTEQATYLGTKYLPAVANLKSTTLNTKNTLAAKVAQLNAQRRQDAEGTVSAEQKAEQDQAYKQAQLDLGYARLNKSSGGSGSGKSTAAQDKLADAAGAASLLSRSQGKDGHVNPVVWRQAATAWQQAGYSLNDFVKQYRNFINPHDKNAHYVGYN